jgi:hypothetical protein
MQHYKDVLIWCSEGVQIFVMLFLVWQAYHSPSPDDKTKAKTKRFVIVACFVLFFSYIFKMSIEHMH